MIGVNSGGISVSSYHLIAIAATWSIGGGVHGLHLHVHVHGSFLFFSVARCLLLVWGWRQLRPTPTFAHVLSLTPLHT